MHMAVDGTIKHANCEEDDEEDEERKKDVGFGVERKEGGTSIQAAHTVPTQQGQEANHQRQDPAEGHQAIDPIVGLCGRLLGQRFHHSGVTLHSNEQQTEDRGCQGHKQHPFSEKPQSRGEMEGLAPRHADVDQVGCTSQEITERDVGNAHVNPPPAVSNAGHDGH